MAVLYCDGILDWLTNAGKKIYSGVKNVYQKIKPIADIVVPVVSKVVPGLSPAINTVKNIADNYLTNTTNPTQ